MWLLCRLRCCCLVLASFASLCATAQARTGTVSLSDAVQSVIQKHPLIHYQQAQVQIDEGLRLQASGAFDTVLTADISQAHTTIPLTAYNQAQYALIGVNGNSETSDVTQLDISISRLFRSGVGLAATGHLSRNVDNLLNPRGVNTSNPQVSVTVPLLQGRGRKAVAANEMAAQTEIKASELDLTYEVSSLLLAAVTDYWNLVASQRLLAVARDAEDRAKADLENTGTLVEADHLPRGNLNEVRAGLDQAMSSRIAAEQNLYASQYQLAADIGMDRDQIASTLLLAIDDFPASLDPSQSLLTEPQMLRYVTVALHNRSDFQALTVRIEEQELLVVAAKNHLLPQLNASVAGGYNGLEEGRRFSDAFTSIGSSLDGPSITGGLSYNFPIRNEAARGNYLKTTSIESQLQAQQIQLTHTITSSVLNAARAVQNAVLQADKARAAVQAYRESLAGQREKYHVGIASVVDVLTVEDRLTTAMTAAVQAEQAYALALIQFRFATGTIVSPGVQPDTVDATVLRTLPDLMPEIHTEP